MMMAEIWELVNERWMMDGWMPMEHIATTDVNFFL